MKTLIMYIVIFLHYQRKCMSAVCIHVMDLIMLELNTEKEGCMSYTTPEDAQRPRAVYDIHPDFRGI